MSVLSEVACSCRGAGFGQRLVMVFDGIAVGVCMGVCLIGDEVHIIACSERRGLTGDALGADLIEVDCSLVTSEGKEESTKDVSSNDDIGFNW